MVGYCQNMVDCRRSIQLQYFGEVFDALDCRNAADTSCDNCRKGSFEKQVMNQDFVFILSFQ